MVTLSQIQDFMTRQAEEDKKIKSVQVEGETAEDALEQASVELGVAVKHLEYEVLERGDKGFLGLGKKLWVLRAYEAAQGVEMPDAVLNHRRTGPEKSLSGSFRTVYSYALSHP